MQMAKKKIEQEKETYLFMRRVGNGLARYQWWRVKWWPLLRAEGRLSELTGPSSPILVVVPLFSQLVRK